ncbi:MAG: hypothetical protein GC161_03030 [Planctomycetaceae bacterium]|nr:hypothetical protein [Planctomycetaceae bacterium]
MSHSLASLVLLLTGPGFAAAASPDGQVRLVPGLYPTIQAAVDASSNGDVVVVAAGSYPGFEIAAKSVAVEAAPEAVVAIVGRVTVRDLALEQRVVLHGLRGTAPAGGGAALLVANNDGPVRVESCHWRGGDALFGTPFVFALPGDPAVQAQNTASLAFAGGTAQGGQGASIKDEDFQWNMSSGGAAMEFASTGASLYSMDLVGGAGGDNYDTTADPAGDGGSGILATASTLFLSRVQSRGGRGGFADCETLFGGCGSNGDGGHGVELVGSTATSRASVLLGGTASPGSPFGPSAGTPGSPVDGEPGSFTDTFGPSVYHVATSPVLLGDPVQLRFAAPAGQIAVFLISGEPHAALAPLDGAGPFLLAPSGLVTLVLGPIPASGFANFPAVTPVGTGSGSARTVFTQGALLDASTSSVHLADPSHVTLVDGLP